MVNGVTSAKPFVSLRVSNGGGTATYITVQNQSVIGTPGIPAIVNDGYNTTVTPTRGTAGATNIRILDRLAPSWYRLRCFCSIQNRWNGRPYS